MEPVTLPGKLAAALLVTSHLSTLPFDAAAHLGSKHANATMLTAGWFQTLGGSCQLSSSSVLACSVSLAFFKRSGPSPQAFSQPSHLCQLLKYQRCGCPGSPMALHQCFREMKTLEPLCACSNAQPKIYDWPPPTCPLNWNRWLVCFDMHDPNSSTVSATLSHT